MKDGQPGRFDRILRPRSIAVIGGGAWCEAIVGAASRIGFSGSIHPVHPTRSEISGLKAVPSIQDLPIPVDCAFVGINRQATIHAVAELQKAGAGGAVCFASGFTEAAAEDAAAVDLQQDLVRAAGPMPILGPNCYGYVNALDKACIWPDQHGMKPLDSGVAILTQSSNIAINLTMQKRALPLAMMVACGNQAQTSQAELAIAQLDDPRITAIGVHVEGFGDQRQWETLAEKAHRQDVPVVVLKVGRSTQAQAATISHTASMAGEDTGAQAFLDRMGFARVDDVPSFLEALKLFHVCGRLSSKRLAAISCSGGEASLIADMALAHDVEFPVLEPVQTEKLREALGPMVALANPLDYHTYVWRDAGAMAQAWSAMTGPDIGMTVSIVDYPHTDRADWECATRAAKMVVDQTGRPFAMAATLPELMPEDVAKDLLAHGVLPISGLREGLTAIEAAARPKTGLKAPLTLTGPCCPTTILTEADAKAALAEFGLDIPRSVVTAPAQAQNAAMGLTAPLAVKGVGLAHKTDANAVRLNCSWHDVEQVAHDIGTNPVLIEEMVRDVVAELLVGVIRDPAHGFILTLAQGGIWTELIKDTVSLLVPSSRTDILQALMKLRFSTLLLGFRGKPAVRMAAVLDAVEAIQNYVMANAKTVIEVEVNPMICTPDRAVAADALIRLGETE